MKEEWAFAKRRKKLINFVRKALQEGWKPHMAEDIVDAIFLDVWTYLKEENSENE